jgi:hypothetical protein
MSKTSQVVFSVLVAGLAAALAVSPALASGGSGGSGGGGGTQVDTIKVSKCYYQVGSGEGLIKASSSDSTARLYAYLPDGTLYGEVQNGGGSRYGGTVMPYLANDPVYVTIRSTSGGSVTVQTTPFQL